MTTVALRYKVSSSFLQVSLTWLNVPRPERGYWAKLAVGKVSKQPSLPEAEPGDLWYHSNFIEKALTIPTVSAFSFPPRLLYSLHSAPTLRDATFSRENLDNCLQSGTGTVH